MADKEFSLEIRSRPIRIAFLVKTSSELSDAIMLYTHLWGGAINYVFRIAITEDDSDELGKVLNEINVDIIAYFEGSLNSITETVLSSLPSVMISITKSKLEEHADGINLFRLSFGQIEHNSSVLEDLFQERPSNIDFVVIDQQSKKYACFIQHFNGNPSDKYNNYIKNRYGASVLKAPTSIEDLIKTELILSNFISPLKATLFEVNSQINLFGSLFDPLFHTQTISLFLDDSKSLDISTAYWNMRIMSKRNTLFLPKREFLSKLQSSMSTILEAMPSLHAIQVFTSTSLRKAREIHDNIHNAMNQIGKEIPIRVNYGKLDYYYLSKDAYTGQSTSFTRSVNDDGSLRFVTIDPKGHRSENTIYGYSAKYRSSSTSKLFMPQTLISSLLLSNEIERLRMAEENNEGLGRRWLRERLVRVGADGITGIAKTGKESRFYYHDAESIVYEHIKFSGIVVKPGRHTRYAQGLIRRFGGFHTAMLLLKPSTIAILEGLFAYRAEQSGFVTQRISSYLKDKGFEKPNDIVKNELPRLISSGLVRRGYAIKCINCDLQDWYPLDVVGSPIRCNGCAEFLELPLTYLEFSYTANELVKRFIESGGRSVFMAADILRKIDYKSNIHFGGEIFRSGENKSFAEADLFWLTNDFLCVVECKDYKEIDSKALDEIKISFFRLVNNVASVVGAKVAILCILTNSSNPEIFRFVSKISNEARKKGLGVHLIVNRKFYLWGNESSSDAELDTSELMVGENKIYRLKSIGSDLKRVVFGGKTNDLDKSTMRLWLSDLSEGHKT